MGHLLKYGSLGALTLQNAAAMICIRYSRTRSNHEIAIASTVVIMSEVCKLIICLLVVLKEEGDLRTFFKSLKSHIFTSPIPIDRVFILLPAFVYLVQNNLLYVAGTHLDTAVYHVAYQLKIFATAIFSVIILKKKLGLVQWLSLVLLVGGVCAVQLSQIQNGETGRESRQRQHEVPAFGLAAIIGAALCSGFAGISIEKIIKGSSVSLWMRGVQLSLISILVGIGSSFYGLDSELIRRKGFFYGYDAFVVGLVILQGCGGILVGMVMKYLDNLLKCFGYCFSIIISASVSILFFDFQLTARFTFGVALVITAVFLYGSHVQVNQLCKSAIAFLLKWPTTPAHKVKVG